LFTPETGPPEFCLLCVLVGASVLVHMLEGTTAHVTHASAYATAFFSFRSQSSITSPMVTLTVYNHRCSSSITAHGLYGNVSLHNLVPTSGETRHESLYYTNSSTNCPYGPIRAVGGQLTRHHAQTATGASGTVQVTQTTVQVMHRGRRPRYR
jgi:hypothetical protein